MKTVRYRPEYQSYFERLNKAWLSKYFEVEPLDEWMLTRPEEAILKDGGSILFIEHQQQVIGTVALIRMEQGVYELAKMAVEEAFQGLGAGKLLCQTAIEEAKRLNAKKLILFTNSRLKAALCIYHEFGFKNIPFEGAQFKRADVKMELPLQRNTISAKWFDKRFDFNLGMDQYGNLLERLQHVPDVFKKTVAMLPEEVQLLRPNNKWSIRENIGHLVLLEPLWRTRFQEIKEGKIDMSPADVTNRATGEIGFNKMPVQGLIETFSQERNKTITFLNGLQQEDFSYSSIHPRLQQPMRIIDLMYFVAEHDQHHLHTVLSIINQRWEQQGYLSIMETASIK